MPSFLKIRLINWPDLKRFRPILLSNDWIFRGQASSTWSLATTIERSFQCFECPNQLRRTAELEIIREFQRGAGHFLSRLPAPTDYVEWLALMQHHGAPTRLLDFTYSFYVAAFFASEGAADEAAIWAINLPRLHGQTIPKYFPDLELERIALGTLLDTSNQRAAELLFNMAAPQGILHVEPETKNQRLHVQQGLFLFPGDLERSFETNLASSFGWTEEFMRQSDESPLRSDTDALPRMLADTDVFKMCMMREQQLEALQELRVMNISAETLFPGIDGFCRSLRRFTCPSTYPSSWQPDSTRAEWRVPR